MFRSFSPSSRSKSFALFPSVFAPTALFKINVLFSIHLSQPHQ